jgi:hypothetical protein
MGQKDAKRVMTAIDRLLKRATRIEIAMGKDLDNISELLSELEDLRQAFELVKK